MKNNNHSHSKNNNINKNNQSTSVNTNANGKTPINQRIQNVQSYLNHLNTIFNNSSNANTYININFNTNIINNQSKNANQNQKSYKKVNTHNKQSYFKQQSSSSNSLQQVVNHQINHIFSSSSSSSSLFTENQNNKGNLYQYLSQNPNIKSLQFQFQSTSLHNQKQQPIQETNSVQQLQKDNQEQQQKTLKNINRNLRKANQKPYSSLPRESQSKQKSNFVHQNNQQNQKLYHKLSSTKSEKKLIKKKKTPKIVKEKQKQIKNKSNTPQIPLKQFAKLESKNNEVIFKIPQQFQKSTSQIPKISIGRVYNKQFQKSINSNNTIRGKQIKNLSKILDKTKLKGSFQKDQQKPKINIKSDLKFLDLHTKRALCEAQSTYINSALSLNKQQIQKMSKTSKKFAQQSMLRIFCIKILKKFFNHMGDKNYKNDAFKTPSSPSNSLANESNIIETLKDPEILISQALQLPQIIRKRNVIPQQLYKQTCKQKSFLQQKFSNLGISYQKEVLFDFTIQLCNYIEFLVVNDIARITKRVLAQSQQLNSDRKSLNLKEKKKNKSGLKSKRQNQNYSQKSYS